MNIAVHPKYERFKPTDVKWAPEAPEHWDVRPLSAAARVVSEANQPELELLSVYLGRGVIRFSDVDEKRTNATSTDLSKYQIVRPGNLVLNNQQAWRGSVGVSAHKGIVSPAYIVLDLGDSFDPRFADYYFQTPTTVSHFLVSSKGVGTIQRNLYWPALKRCPITTPPLPEQRAIAAFLDKKCAKIDEAVRIEEEQIKLLRERRQILIQQAVTRGLNPDAPMKDSGIDWIGQIPAHWEVRRGKHLFREVNERSEEGAEELLSVSHTTGVTSRSEKNVYMFMAEDYTGSKLCRPGDVVINTMWAWMGALGVSDLTGIISPSYGVYRPLQEDAFNRRFLEWLLRTTPFIEQYNKVSTGLHSSRLRLYPHMFLGLPMAFPVRDEQDDVVAHVESAAEKIYKAISIKKDQIAALQEYKTSLINEAVTGKIKVI